MKPLALALIGTLALVPAARAADLIVHNHTGRDVRVGCEDHGATGYFAPDETRRLHIHHNGELHCAAFDLNGRQVALRHVRFYGDRVTEWVVEPG